MSLYKRGSIWWIRFTKPDGGELRETTQTADRRQAQEYHDTRKAELWRVAKLGESVRHTWQEAVVRWLEEHPDRKSLRSVVTPLRQADHLLGGLYLDQIHRDLLTQFVQERRAAGCRNSTINTSLSAIRAVLRAAHRWEWLNREPSIPLLPVVTRRIRWLTREDADRLIAELPPHLAAMVRFSLATGLRESNVCGLEWAQIDLDRRVAWIHADQAKAGKPIHVPLNTDAVVVLREQVGKHPRFAFPYQDSRVLRANTTTFRKALARAGIADFRWHDLRHTWASWHVQAGTSLLVLKELGGWATLNMVLRYAHLGAEHLAEHAERISGPRLVRTNSGTAPQKVTATG